MVGVVEGVVGMFLVVVVVRVLVEGFGMGWGNPLVQGVGAMTEWAVGGVRRVLPRVGGVDLAGVMVVWAVATAKVAVPLVMGGYGFRWGGVMVLGVAEGADTAVWVLIVAVLVCVVVSWVAPGSRHAGVQLAEGLGRPLMGVVQRWVPSFGGLDFSPVVVLMGLNGVQGLVVGWLGGVGRGLL